MKILCYEVCATAPGIMGSGFNTSREVRVRTEEEAFAALNNNRDRLTRLIEDESGHRVHHYWSICSQHWEDMDGHPLLD